MRWVASRVRSCMGSRGAPTWERLEGVTVLVARDSQSLAEAEAALVADVETWGASLTLLPFAPDNMRLYRVDHPAQHWSDDERLRPGRHQ